MINESRRSTIFSNESHSSIFVPVSTVAASTIKIYYFNKPTYKIMGYTSSSTVFEMISKALMEYTQDLCLDQTIITSKDPKSIY